MGTVYPTPKPITVTPGRNPLDCAMHPALCALSVAQVWSWSSQNICRPSPISPKSSPCKSSQSPRCSAVLHCFTRSCVLPWVLIFPFMPGAFPSPRRRPCQPFFRGFSLEHPVCPSPPDMSSYGQASWSCWLEFLLIKELPFKHTSGWLTAFLLFCSDCPKPQAECRLWKGKETALCRPTEKRGISEDHPFLCWARAQVPTCMQS